MSAICLNDRLIYTNSMTNTVATLYAPFKVSSNKKKLKHKPDSSSKSFCVVLVVYLWWAQITLSTSAEIHLCYLVMSTRIHLGNTGTSSEVSGSAVMSSSHRVSKLLANNTLMMLPVFTYVYLCVCVCFTMEYPWREDHRVQTNCSAWVSLIPVL